MDTPAPKREYHEGPEAARKFEQWVKQTISIPPSERKKREHKWREERKRAKRDK